MLITGIIPDSVASSVRTIPGFGQLNLYGATSGYTGLKAAAAAGSAVFQLPSSDGTNGQAVVTNGSGVLSFASAGVSAHSGLTGLTGSDDHTQYALLTPTASSRNVIQPSTTGIVPLTLQLYSGTTDNIQEWKNSSGTKYGRFITEGLSFGTEGSGGNNAFMCIGEGGTAFKKTDGTTAALPGRGVGGGSDWSLYCSGSKAASLSGSIFAFNGQVSFGTSATGIVESQSVDVLMSFQAFHGGTQARVGNGISLIGGKGGTGGSGNYAGGNIIIQPGASTGNATPATIALKGSTAGSSGGGVQTLSDVLVITNATTVTLSDAVNIATGTTTGTKIGTATTQKLGFYNKTPVVQRPKASYNNWAALSDVVNALVDLGLFDAA